MTALRAPSIWHSEARAINGSGQVAGFAGTASRSCWPEPRSDREAPVRAYCIGATRACQRSTTPRQGQPGFDPGHGVERGDGHTSLPMMNIGLLDAIGLCGVAVYVAAHFCVQVLHHSPTARLSIALNLIGPLCVLASLAGAFNLASFLSQCFWFGLTLLGWLRRCAADRCA